MASGQQWTLTTLKVELLIEAEPGVTEDKARQAVLESLRLFGAQGVAFSSVGDKEVHVKTARLPGGEHRKAAWTLAGLTEKVDADCVRGKRDTGCHASGYDRAIYAARALFPNADERDQEVMAQFMEQENE